MTRPANYPRIGERFGAWTVRDHTVNNRHKMTQSVVECDCGRFAVVINANLREGKSTQCRPCATAARAADAPPPAPPRVKRLSDTDINRIRTLLRRGQRANAIAVAEGLSADTVRRIDRGMIARDVPWPHGLEPRQSLFSKRLTLEQVREIKRRLLDGERGSEIARALGVPVNTVSRVKCGEVFTYVEWPETK